MARTKAEIDLLREGFIDGRYQQCIKEMNGCTCEEKAAEEYPYPKETRLREVAVSCHGSTAYYSLHDGHLFLRYLRASASYQYYTEDQLAQLASLLPAERLRQIADSGKCGPTEEVEVE